jgi:hypothetical protein
MRACSEYLGVTWLSNYESRSVAKLFEVDRVYVSCLCVQTSRADKLEHMYWLSKQELQDGDIYIDLVVTYCNPSHLQFTDIHQITV